MPVSGQPEHMGVCPPLGLPVPENREDTHQWVSACDYAAGHGLSRLTLPVMTMKQRSSDECEQQSDLDQPSECGGSSLVEDQWQEMSFIPVYCGDMMAQLTAACSSTSHAAQQPLCKQTSGERPAAVMAPPSSSLMSAAATGVRSGTPKLMLNMVSATPAVGRQWGVMDVADLTADCAVSFGPDTPVDPGHRTWASQFHSLCTYEDQQQQFQEGSVCTLQQQFHSLCLQPQEDQQSSVQQTEPLEAAATAHGNIQQAGSAVQLQKSCQPTAASTANLKTPCLNEDVHALPSLASVESLDSLAVLPLHNPYQQGLSNVGLCGLDAAMFMGEF